jgi:hypothetical protein
MTNIMMGLAIAFKTISLNQDYRRDDHYHCRADDHL